MTSVVVVKKPRGIEETNRNVGVLRVLPVAPQPSAKADAVKKIHPVAVLASTRQ